MLARWLAPVYDSRARRRRAGDEAHVERRTYILCGVGLPRQVVLKLQQWCKPLPAE